MRNNVLSKIDKNVVSLIDGISSDCWQKLKTDSFLRIFLVNLYMVVLMILTFLSFLLMIVWLLDHLFRLETLTLDLSIALIKVKPWLIDVLSFGVNVFNMSLEILFAYTFVKLVLYLRDYWHIITVHHFYIYNGTVVCWCDENFIPVYDYLRDRSTEKLEIFADSIQRVYFFVNWAKEVRMHEEYFPRCGAKNNKLMILCHLTHQRVQKVSLLNIIG